MNNRIDEDTLNRILLLSTPGISALDTTYPLGAIEKLRDISPVAASVFIMIINVINKVSSWKWRCLTA